jgi:hypothetical protein
MELILKALYISEESTDKPFFLYDPCCGEGEALSLLTQAFKEMGASKTRSYGSEIEEGRFEVAREVLDVVLHEGYQFVRTEPKFNLLWLNPPYQQNFSERAELTFLRALTGTKQGVLQKDGILLFCIPQYVVKDTAGVLSGHLQKSLSHFFFLVFSMDMRANRSCANVAPVQLGYIKLLKYGRKNARRFHERISS